MNLYELKSLYARLAKVITTLNNYNFNTLDTKIDYDIQLACNESFKAWYNNLPEKLLIQLYGCKSRDDNPFIDEIRDTYSIPYLHLNNTDWAKDICSKGRNNRQFHQFLHKYSDLINFLAQNLSFSIKYFDIEGLSEDQKKKLADSLNSIKRTRYLIDLAEENITNWNKVDKNINVTNEFIRKNSKSFSNFFYQTTEKDNVFEKIENISSQLLKKFELTSINNIQQRIKNIWNYLKRLTIQKEANIPSNVNLQRLFENLPDNLHRIALNFENLQDILNTSDEVFNREYELLPSEAQRLKSYTQRILDSIKSRAYPKLTGENLSADELELISLLNVYQNYPLDRDKEVGEVIKQLNTVNTYISDLLEIAKTRYEANFLNDDDYNEWNNLELRIFVSFSKAYEEAKKIKEVPKKENSSEKIKKEYKKKIANYNALIENITGEKVDLSKTTDLPDFVIDQVNQTPVNLDNLKATLRPYQKFAAKYILTFKNVLLGDEMGLGKTLESLSVANHLYQNGKNKIIVIGPLSVVANWENEINSKTNMPHYVFHGDETKSSLEEWKNAGGILLTNYEQCKKINDLDSRLKIDLSIVDEAHNIKNPEAQRTKSAKKLLQNSEYKLLMSGTPLENRLSEMNDLITILNPSLGNKLQDSLFISQKQYKKEIATVYLRRKRIDVLKELPLINMIESWSNFNEAQINYYQKAIEEGMSGFQKLRRAAFIGENSEKIEQIKHICEDARNNNEKVVVFSYFKEDVLFKLQKILPFVADKPITGDVKTSEERQEIIDKFSNSPDQSVLLCQIGAAGFGLNIQAASQVILCEPQLKPSTENQAISRAYRMGQTKNVTVYHLLTKNSIDETMMNLLQYKQKLFNKYANDSVAAEMMQEQSDSSESLGKFAQHSIKKEIFNIEKTRLSEKMA